MTSGAKYSIIGEDVQNGITVKSVEYRVDGTSQTPDADGRYYFDLTSADDSKYVEIINTVESDAYELPSTGSTGTIPYTTGGILLMGAALVCDIHRHKRGRRDE